MPRNSDIDPDLLAAIDEEQKHASASRRGDQLKLEPGDTVIFRPINVQLGPKKTFFYRVAKHWIGKTSAMLCPRQTPEAFGGDPDAACPVCDLVEKYRNDRDRDIADSAYSGIAKDIWGIFGIVKELNDNVSKPPELYVPTEFSIWSKQSMDDFLGSYKKEAKYGVNILDPIQGYDWTFKRGKKGQGTDMDMDRRPSLIFDLPTDDEIWDKYEEIIAKASKAFQLPRLPASKQSDEFADKFEDMIERAGDGGGRSRDRDREDRGGRSRRHTDDASGEDDLNDRPARSEREDRGSRDQDRGRDREERPARPERRSETADDRAASRGGGRADGHEERPSSPPRTERDRDVKQDERPGRPEREERPARDERPALSKDAREARDERRTSDSRSTRREEEPRSARREEQPPAARSRENAPSSRRIEEVTEPPARRRQADSTENGGAESTVDEETDLNITEERREHVPPAERMDVGAEPPPDVNISGADTSTASRSPLRDRLKGSLDRANNRP